MQKEPGQLFRVLFAFPDGNVGEVSCPDLYICHRKPANKKSSVFLKKISKIRFDILCITFKPPEMPALKVVI